MIPHSMQKHAPNLAVLLCLIVPRAAAGSTLLSSSIAKEWLRQSSAVALAVCPTCEPWAGLALCLGDPVVKGLVPGCGVSRNPSQDCGRAAWGEYVTDGRRPGGDIVLRMVRQKLFFANRDQLLMLQEPCETARVEVWVRGCVGAWVGAWVRACVRGMLVMCTRFSGNS